MHSIFAWIRLGGLTTRLFIGPIPVLWPIVDDLWNALSLRVTSGVNVSLLASFIKALFAMLTFLFLISTNYFTYSSKSSC